MLRVADVHRTVGGEGRAVPAVARRRDAVEQVDPALHRRHQILRESHAHKITWGGGELRLEPLQHVVHDRLGLPDGKATDGQAGPGAELENAAEAFGAKLQMGAAGLFGLGHLERLADDLRDNLGAADPSVPFNYRPHDAD